ncbi:MAG: 50S ribosomal protein L1, partial [Candidatus Bathyarchaeota archaeon]
MPISKENIAKAVEEVKKNSEKRQFTQSVDLIVTLRDMDLKRPENRINELFELPYAPNPDVKIVVFATGDLALRAERAGSDTVLSRTDIENFASNKKEAKKLAQNTDFFLAETSLMATVGKVLGPILGPRGKMPTPVPPIAPIDNLIQQYKRMVRVRIRDQPNAQVRVGTEEMSDEFLAENIHTLLNLLERRFERG